MEFMHNGKTYGLKDTIHIRGPRPGDNPRIIGMPVGEVNAPNVRRARDLTTAVQSAVDRAHEVRTNSLLTSAERADRVREQSAGAIAALEKTAQEVEAESARLRQASWNLKPSLPYESVSHHVPFFDLRLADAFNALAAIPRESKFAQLVADPALDVHTADALARLPLALSGLTIEQHSALSDSMLKRFRGDKYEALQTEIAQCELARRAVHASVEVLSETIGSFQEVHAGAPTAIADFNARSQGGAA